MLALLMALPLFGADSYLFTSFRRNGDLAMEYESSMFLPIKFT
jgi:hypothetical protein